MACRNTPKAAEVGAPLSLVFPAPEQPSANACMRFMWVTVSLAAFFLLPLLWGISQLPG